MEGPRLQLWEPRYERARGGVGARSSVPWRLLAGEHSALSTLYTTIQLHVLRTASFLGPWLIISDRDGS